MRSIVLLSALVCVAALGTGCSRKADAATSTPSASSTAAAAGELGVPECDTYMKKYTTCIDNKAPKEVKDAMKTAFEQQKTAWKQAASTDDGKKALASACKQADDAAKAGMTAYGCAW